MYTVLSQLELVYTSYCLQWIILGIERMESNLIVCLVADHTIPHHDLSVGLAGLVVGRTRHKGQ